MKFESPFGRVGLVACEGSVCFEGAAASGMVCVSQWKRNKRGIAGKGKEHIPLRLRMLGKGILTILGSVGIWPARGPNRWKRSCRSNRYALSLKRASCQGKACVVEKERTYSSKPSAFAAARASNCCPSVALCLGETMSVNAITERGPRINSNPVGVLVS